MDTIRQALIERSLKRSERWKTKTVNALPFPHEIPETHIIGTYSRVLLESKQRIVLRPATVILNDATTLETFGEMGEIAPDAIRETLSCVARDYLKEIFGHGPLLKSSQRTYMMRGYVHHPLLAVPQKFERGYYLDIASAYYSIVQIVGWNVDYWPGKWMGRGRPTPDFPFPAISIARNCLVSSAAEGRVSVWKPGDGAKNYDSYNPLENLCLIRIVSDILSCIAYDVVTHAHAQYAHTDGFILTDMRDLKIAQQIIGDWSLTSRIKAQGPGYINGPGCYKVGKKESNIQLEEKLPFSNIARLKHSGWLQKRLAWASQFGGLEFPP